MDFSYTLNLSQWKTIRLKEMNNRQFRSLIKAFLNDDILDLNFTIQEYIKEATVGQPIQLNYLDITMILLSQRLLCVGDEVSRADERTGAKLSFNISDIMREITPMVHEIPEDIYLPSAISMEVPDWDESINNTEEYYRYDERLNSVRLSSVSWFIDGKTLGLGFVRAELLAFVKALYRYDYKEFLRSEYYFINMIGGSHHDFMDLTLVEVDALLRIRKDTEEEQKKHQEAAEEEAKQNRKI